MAGMQERERQGKVSEEETQSVNLKRRRLVKGLAGAAPGIFTLYSGNAVALASATQRCILSERESFDGTAVIASDDFFTDAYQRGTLKELAIEVKNGNVTKWLAAVPDSEGKLHWYEAEISAAGGVSWNQSSQEWVQCLGEDGKRTFQEPLGSCASNGKGDWKETNADRKQAHSLFCVDDDGNVVSAYPVQCSNQGLAPVNRSCWASIDPGAPDPTALDGWW